ncbi:hypothetical protein C6341_g21108 [Phytophthora cactorum]|nr:hypothetical protein C6341_g21108 [Phytophthora cactorum]
MRDDDRPHLSPPLPLATTIPRAPPRLSSSTPPRRVATEEERQRVLDAYEAGDDWLTVARYNNVSRAAAYRLCKSGDPSSPPRGRARANCVKCTNKMVAALEEYLEENCTLTLVQLRDKIMGRFQVDVSTSTISAKLCEKLITLKQIRKEPSTWCFSVFKARVKAYLAEQRHRIFVQGAHLNMTEARISLLKDAATVPISCMNRHLVVAMALHCQRFVADALKMEDMEYGV